MNGRDVRRAGTDGPLDESAAEGRELAGIVRAQLPSGLYQVELEGGHRVTAHIGGGLDRNFVRLLVGDRVLVAVTPRDLARGRVVKKL